jgi:hypothetical protein
LLRLLEPEENEEHNDIDRGRLEGSRESNRERKVSAIKARVRIKRDI